jgi:hypothetical protein
LLLITAICIWLGIQVNAARRQREAVAVLFNAGVGVAYDYEMVPQPPLPLPVGVPTGTLLPDETIDKNQLPSGPAWLRKWVGDEYFRSVVAVYLNDTKPSIGKAELDQLVRLPRIRQLVFVEAPAIEDKDLTSLAEQLQELQFIHTRISGAMLTFLPNPGRLKDLCLRESEVDDAALEQIEKMTALQVLWLDSTHVTDAGLAHLQYLHNLRNLMLDNTQISDVGLRYLTNLKGLTFLSLTRTQTTRAGISELRAALPNANIVGP